MRGFSWLEELCFVMFVRSLVIALVNVFLSELCATRGARLYPKLLTVRSTPACCTIDYLISPLPFWHVVSSLHSPRLIRRRHRPSITVLASRYYLPHTQPAVTSLLKYLTKWKLRLNAHKIESILFSKRQPPPPSRTLFKSMTPLRPGPLQFTISALC